eukprot:gene14939-20994_t
MVRDTSPTGSVRSVVSTRSTRSVASTVASEHVARRIPPALLNKTKEEPSADVAALQKELEDVKARAEGRLNSGAGAPEAEGAGVMRQAGQGLKARLANQELVESSKNGALASGKLVEGLQKHLQEALAGLESAGDGAGPAEARALGSSGVCLGERFPRGMVLDRMRNVLAWRGAASRCLLGSARRRAGRRAPDAFEMLGESKEALSDVKDEKAALMRELEELRSQVAESASATTAAHSDEKAALTRELEELRSQLAESASATTAPPHIRNGP